MEHNIEQNFYTGVNSTSEYDYQSKTIHQVVPSNGTLNITDYSRSFRSIFSCHMLYFVYICNLKNLS